MTTDSIVGIAGLNKWYGDFHVLRDINVDVAKGERIVICGPSGSGKSTFIRCINALEEFQEGRIVVDGIELGPQLRRVDEVRRDQQATGVDLLRGRRVEPGGDFGDAAILHGDRHAGAAIGEGGVLKEQVKHVSLSIHRVAAPRSGQAWG